MSNYAKWFLDDTLADHATVPDTSGYKTLVAWQAFVTTMPAAPGATAFYLMFFDNTTTPTIGDKPLWCTPAFLQVNQWYSWIDDVAPVLEFFTGLTWALSSTPDTYTAVGAGGKCRVDVKLGANNG